MEPLDVEMARYTLRSQRLRWPRAEAVAYGLAFLLVLLAMAVREWSWWRVTAAAYWGANLGSTLIGLRWTVRKRRDAARLIASYEASLADTKQRRSALEAPFR